MTDLIKTLAEELKQSEKHIENVITLIDYPVYCALSQGNARVDG